MLVKIKLQFFPKVHGPRVYGIQVQANRCNSTYSKRVQIFTALSSYKLAIIIIIIIIIIIGIIIIIIIIILNSLRLCPSLASIEGVHQGTVKLV